LKIAHIHNFIRSICIFIVDTIIINGIGGNLVKLFEADIKHHEALEKEMWERIFEDCTHS
jgi:hypothetical protein